MGKKPLGKFKNNVNIFFKSLFITEWKKQINQFSDSKLKIYNICKNNFGLEKYLTIGNNFELRRSFTKLRTSSHRYQGVSRHNRVCTKCSSNVIEDDYIFYLNAQITMKTENQCCLKLQLHVVTLEI